MLPLDPAVLRQRLPPNPVTRFAPSPTGFLHLGHVANAVFVWGITRALGGRVLLRMEDHDRGRSRPEYERATLEDLEWLGLIPSGATFYRQSDGERNYRTALERLERAAQVYGCDCSRKHLAAELGDPFDEETRYTGRCRNRGLALANSAGIRVVMDPGEETFTDALLGAVAQSPAHQCGDLLLRDRNGNWTYQFAVVVDDVRQGVDLVIRGEDLLASTGRQIRLARLLGRADPPVFLHHPLIRKQGGAKLSKSSGDTGVRELREAGATAAAVLGRAAWLVGLIEQQRPIAPDELELLMSP